MAGHLPVVPRLNLLFSYAYIRHKAVPEEAVVRLSKSSNVLIDSGAFTNYVAMRKSIARGHAYAPVTVDDYIDFCQRVHGEVFQYIALDVIRNPTETAVNLTRMLDAGLAPMAVVVQNAPSGMMERAVERNPFVCVAGGVDGSDKYIRARYKRIADELPGVGIHALGFLRWPDVFHLPIFSGDSSSFSSGSRFGMLAVYRRDKGFKNFQCRSLLAEGLSSRTEKELMRRLLPCDVTIDMLHEPGAFSGYGGLPAMFTIHAYMQFHRHCRERGFQFFWAVSNVAALCQLAAVLANERADGTFNFPAARETMESLRATKGKDEKLERVYEIIEAATVQDDNVLLHPSLRKEVLQ